MHFTATELKLGRKYYKEKTNNRQLKVYKSLSIDSKIQKKCNI